MYIMNKIIEILRKFNREREWEQFHTPDNLVKSLVIESTELLELFQWQSSPKSEELLKEELADVFLYALMIADHFNLNVEEITLEKIKKNEAKYPVDKAKGKSKKYNEL